MINNNFKLQIVIPTYNREKELEKTLKALLEQEDKNFELVILDNKSNYDIEKFYNLFQNTDINFVIKKKKFNTGLIGNLTDMFTIFEQGWLWTLSDDDVIYPYTVKIIREKILELKNNEDVAMLKFVLKKSEKNKEIEIDNLIDFYKFYTSSNDVKGNLIFLSTNIYNIDVVKKYYEKLYEYSYTYISFLLPPLFSLLESKKVKIIFLKTPILKYIIPEKEKRHKINVFLGISTIFNIDFGLSPKNRKLFYKTFTTNHFLRIIEVALNNNLNKSFQIYSLKYLYKNQYKYILNFIEKIIFLGIIFLSNLDFFKNLILRILLKLEKKYINRLRKIT